MTRILRIDSSARTHGSDQAPHGSHTRRLTERFMRRWQAARPEDAVVHRDVGLRPPAPVTARWVEAAFTPPEKRSADLRRELAESDALVDELIAADIILAGVPMYNFGVPAPFKAYIDNIVRVGRTFSFDRTREDSPYTPLLEPGKVLLLLSSRGDYGYGAGGRLADMNYVEGQAQMAFSLIGVTDIRMVAVEYDEFPGSRLDASIRTAEAAVDEIADKLLVEKSPVPA